MSRAIAALSLLGLAGALSSCTVVSVAGTVVSTTASVAGTAVGATADVVGAGVGAVTGGDDDD